MNNKDKLFVGSEIIKAVKNQVKIFLPHVASKNYSMGWFCEDPLEIIVTTKHPPHTFLRTFIHESCHMDQFLEQTELWTDPAINNYGDVLVDYLRGFRKNKTKLVVDYTKGSLKLELDCEQRAVNKIIQYDLSVNIDDYIRTANIYLYSWRYFLDFRCWYDPHKKPYDCAEIVEAMPIHFLTFEEYWEGHDLIRDFMFQYHKILY